MIDRHIMGFGAALRAGLLGSIAMVAVAGSGAAAQTGPGAPAAVAADDAAAGDGTTAAEIIVTANIAFRNRTEDPNPVLSFDLEYFQRFEPVSVGEMLKRVPGVTFTSDVLEYDGVQLRGLPPGFTQVLINGRRAPGGNADRSFFVDRIPAELVERIEIVRAPRADQPSDGIAGTLNVITKEATSFEGGFAKAGALINEDGKVRPSAAIAYAAKVSDTTSVWAALNYQQRRNPKKKVSLRFGDETTGPFDETNDEFDNTELQTDTRDGTDFSGNAELSTEVFGGKLRLGGFFVDTDRDEDETSLTFEGPDLDPDGAEIQAERISQQTYALTADGQFPLGPGELGLAAGWSGFRENSDVTTLEGDTVAEAELDGTETLKIKDDEFSGTLYYSFGADSDFKLKAGVDLLAKTRRGANRAFDDEGEEDGPAAGAIFRIRENRYDPYLRVTFTPVETVTVDAGLRYEITRRTVTSNIANGTDDSASARYNTQSLNPSLHLRYAPSAADQFRASVARTVRRPNYDLISPYEQEESPGDDDITIGNPTLRNERAWGIDAGYERRLGRNGIVGVNFFYRKISDLTELVATGVASPAGGQVVQPRNIGSGKVWGMEVDLSAPLTLFGMDDTGVFANYTYLDSETTDPFTGEKRRFNNQPHHVYNVGFIQTVRSVDASFGASLSGRSAASESNFDETIELTYRPDLEAFIEKRLGKNFVLRFTASNLLDRTKREVFRKYDGDSFAEILENRAAGDIDEFEVERERAGRLFQVTLRAAF
jgi:outer membrane receptor protein involved in Fe transport